MKTRHNIYVGTLLVIAMTQAAHAADITWDSLGANDNWSTFDNWSDNLTPADDDITFNNIGGAAGTTVTSIVDTSYSIDSLNFRQDNTVNHTLSISNGQILTITGSFTPTAGEATAVLFGQPSDAGTLASTTNITGLGTLKVNSAANHFLIGYANATLNPTATVNMSGLSNFDATVDIFGVGRKGTISTNASRQQAGVLTLATNNTITANEISVGSTTHIGGTTGTHNNGGTSTLNLGAGGNATNNLYSDRMSFGIGKASGNMNFAAGVLASDTVTIRAKNTTGAVGTFEIGVRNMSSSSGTPSGTVNFGAGKVDALITTLNIGQWANGAGNSGVDPTGTFTMGTNSASTVTVTTLNLANSGSATAVTTRTVTGNINVTGGFFSATTVNLATGTATTGLTKTANLTLDGGTFRFGTFGTPTGTNAVTINFNRGTVSSIDATGRTLGLAYNLGKAGGGTTVAFGQASGGTGTLTLSGTGTLLGNTTLTTLVDTTLSAAIGGDFSITKNGNANLTLSGANTYTGNTSINLGTLVLNSAGSIANSSQIIVGASTTFDVTAVSFTLGASNAQKLSGTGAIAGNMTVGGNGTLAIGSSPGTMTFGGNLGLNTDSVSNFEINGFTSGTYDLALAAVAGSQTVTFNGGTLNLLFQSGFSTEGTVKIFDFDAYAGSGFTSMVATGLAGGFTASFNATNGIVTVIPEPRVALLGGLGLLAILRRRRAS